MAKKKVVQTESQDFDFEGLAGLTNGAVLQNTDSIKYWIDTGNLALNWICSGKFLGGGFPGGKITEIYGPSSSGKTLWGTNALRGTQAIGGLAVFLDCEHALNKDFAASASRVDTGKILIYAPPCLEDVFNKIYTVIRKVRERYGMEKPLVFVYDSISASPGARELRETEVDEDASKEEWKKIVGGKEQPGERAKICSRELRKLECVLDKNNATVVILNQIRKKIGVMYGPDTTTGGGGMALEFYAGCRVETSVSKRIENKLGSAIGVNLKAKNMKNRCFAPYKKIEGIQLFFEKGINPISGLLDCLIISERIKMKGAGNYEVAEAYAGGKEGKFKTSKEKGVPIDVLVEYPSLIDAKNGEEVREYLSLFENAISQSMSDDTVEHEVKESDFFAESDDDLKVESIVGRD